jgi:hypothetical protein
MDNHGRWTQGAEMTKPTGYLTPWETTLEYAGQLKPGERVEMSVIFVEAPMMPVRRRVSIEEFEADMARVRQSRTLK